MRRERGRPGARPPAIWRAGEQQAMRAARARCARGQSLVEFALVVPLFLLILFGVVEYALINASVGAFNFAAKEAARYEAIRGNGTPPGGFTQIDQYVVNQVILPQVAGVVMAQTQAIVVYRSTETGGCLGTGTTTGSLPNCQYQDVLQPSGGSWKFTQSGWLVGGNPGRQDQLSNADYLGVFISYQYTYLTAFFAIASPTINLSAISVQRIEPQQFGDSDQSQPVAQAGTGPPSVSNPFSAALDLVGFAFILPRRRFGFIAGVRT